MAVTSISYSKPSPQPPVGFGTGSVEDLPGVVARRRRRELLEQYFSPVVSEAAMPSAIDRLILWRSRHGRHRA